MGNCKEIYFDKGPLGASIELPSSKSILNRALVISSLAHGKGSLHYSSTCDDSEAILRALGNSSEKVNVGAAGTAMRFLTALYAAISGSNVLIDGSRRMRQRPIGVLVDALRQCGAEIAYGEREGFPPLYIRGKKLVSPDLLEVDAGISSQYISALLMISPLMRGGVRMKLIGEQKSQPYIDMTIALMRAYGISVERKGCVLSVEEGNYINTDFRVEADWSAASYWYEIASLRKGSRFVLTGLGKHSIQGDSRVAELFESFGVKTIYGDDCVTIESNARCCDSFTVDLTDQPDLAQTVVVTAALLGIPFKVSGLTTLRIKETDRISALCTELAKIGIWLEVDGDDLISYVGGEAKFSGPVTFDTYDDHRMAMSLAPVALALPQAKVYISSPEVVTKSYPLFWQHLSNISALVC